MILAALAIAVSAAAQPIQVDPLAPLPPPPRAVQPAPVAVQQRPKFPIPVSPQPIVPILVAPIVIPHDWRGEFSAIRAGDWAGAQAGIAVLPQSVLTPVAQAELFTAKNSPMVALPQLQALIAQAPDLPQAQQLGRLAVARGILAPPMIAVAKRTVGLGSAPGRYRGKPVGGEPAADSLRSQLDSLIKSDSAAASEALFLSQAPYLSADARAEAAQRVAWSYYSIGQDFDARRVADYWRRGASGEWASQAAWVSGLAAWRQGDCNGASIAFRTVASTATQRELSAGGYYWAARAEQACRRPQSVEPLLKAAAGSPESFYGLIARETLGTQTRIPAASPVSTTNVEALPNVQRAVALTAIGETPLAEQMLRHQARIGSPADQPALIEMAKRLNLAGAQYWLATNGQPGARVQAASRYPMPAWVPAGGGWRIEPALAFAHAIQESSFQSDAVSPAGAVGLLQVRPGTASDLAAAAGEAFVPGSLYDPRFNLEFGQSFIEKMRRSDYTGGQLVKVIASYNAGPLPVGRWATIPDGGDPILWIESIPYWETRYYVPAVMRNLWVYEGFSSREVASLKALAQHRWPGFPATR